MIAEVRSVLSLVCFLTVLHATCIGLPFLNVTVIPDEFPDNGTRMDTMLFDEVSDSRSALCPGYQWDYDLKCSDHHGILLSIGHCATYVKGSGTYATKCPYYQLKGHEIAEQGYIKLPENISELNDYMCGPMKRKGLLCKDCIDGFAVSMTSVGYKCTNCTHMLYGIPLYLISELVPMTAFYLLIFVFQIHLTSTPMTCFILYSQSVMFVLLIDRPPPLEKIVPQYENSFLFNINLLLYGPWNLDFIRYILPPFCVSTSVTLKYMMFLGYVSVLYPLCLIFLTWICIELYGRNFTPIVYILRPFSKCLGKLRRDWSEKRDVVDVFSAFFLLSYSKLMYQSAVCLACQKVTMIDSQDNWDMEYIMEYDSNVTCGSSRYFAAAIPAILSLCVLNVLPALLIVLYPFRKFRACLSKCRLDSLSLSAFMDKYHGCYRNGLNGGKDMRSFAGLYFFLRFLPFLYYPFKLYEIPFTFGSYLVSIFLATTLLVAIVRPYKETYMNIFYILLLGHLTFISQLASQDYFDTAGLQLFSLNLIPVFLLLIFLFYSKIYKACNFKCCRKKSTSEEMAKHNNEVLENLDWERQNASQPLLTPTSVTPSTRSYESIN